MVGEGPGPGGPHPAAPEPPPDRMRIGRARDQRVGRGAAPEGVQVLVRPPEALPPRLGHGEDHVTGGDRQARLPSRCPPGVGVAAMPRGATAVAAAVVDVVVLATAIALSQLPPHRCGPAGAESRDGPALAGQQVLPHPVHVLGPIAPEDVRHLSHADAPAGSAIRHAGGEGRGPPLPERRRQRRGARGGPGAVGAAAVLDAPERHAPCPPLGGSGGPPRLEGGLLGKAALAHPRVAGLVAGGGGHRRRPGPGWEQPGTGPRALPVRPDQRPPPGGQWPAAGLAPLAAPALPQPPVRGPV
jgi:hypothetical protein